MKRVAFIFGSIIAAPLMLVGLVFVASFSFVLITVLTPPCILPTSYHLARMHMIIWRGDMEWDGEVERALDHLQHCKRNKRRLAERLLSYSDGTLASLGMDLVVQESFVDGNRILRQYHDDQRWNHNVTTNDEYSRLLLAAWKMKRGLPVSERDKEVMQRWPDAHFGRLGVTSQNNL